ncbi:hypothetical protein SEA_DAUBENSKI_242 [Streptomyces phage Daubenski]|uniref:Uncharacterized protein n=1 Tax=Streptomyces phage Daubenski TaxID=2653725 RepID=A0A5Q2WIK1_9CAUD|nr:hypothetical protein KNU80_gp063 [Streptomyces phage Daubenski]QGH76509.1 hypothetical protein SEA_DAUBENSKI_242 [Streptomyces phage Daubenski]
MNPGLMMWFGEQVWTDEDWEDWDDDEDWPDDGWSFSFLVGRQRSPNFLV